MKHAFHLDQLLNQNSWKEAIDTELESINKFATFRVLEEDEPLPPGYIKIPYHIIFDVKFDLRHRTRLVAEGNWNVLVNDETHSGVAGMDKVRMDFFLVELSNLKCCASDVSSAHLHGITRENVHFIAGPEFGVFEGRILIVFKSIYGLASSGARWHEAMSDKLRRMGFVPSRTDADMWIRDKGDHCELVATHVDDLLVWLKDETTIINEIKEEFKLKNVGPPDCCLGGDVDCLTKN